MNHRADTGSETHAQDATGLRILANTGALAGSSLWRIGTSFLLQILIARLLGVEAVGQYVTALAILNISQIASELGLPGLLVRDLARMPWARRGTYRIALGIQLGASFVIWALLVVAAGTLTLPAGGREALLFIGFSLPLYAVTSVSRTLFQACERMELVMAVEVTTNTTILVVSLLVMLLGGDVLLLIGVLVLTQALSAILSVGFLLHNRLLAGPQRPVAWQPGQLWQGTRSFFALSLADVLLSRIDILVLNLVAGEYVVGLYSLAYSVVRVLLKLEQSFWQALYPTLSRLWHQDRSRYRTLSLLSLRYAFMLVLPVAALALGGGGAVLVLLFGSQAAAAGPAFQILIWSAPAMLWEMYAVFQLLVHGRPGESLLITGIHILAAVLLIPPFVRFLGVTGAAWAMVAAGGVGLGGALFFLHGRTIPFRLGCFGRLLLCAVVAALVAWWLPMGWHLRMAAAAAAYALLVWGTGVISPTDRLVWRMMIQASRDRFGRRPGNPVQ